VAISAVVVITIAAAAAEPVSAALRFHSAAIVVAAAVVYAGIAASTVLRAALRGAQQFGDYTRNLIAECGIRLVIGMAVLWVTRSALLAVLVYALGTLFATVSALRVVRRMSPEVMPVEMREVAALLGPATILAGAMAVFLNADLILVKRLFDPTTAGIYGAAATVARVMAIVAMPLEAVLVPRIAFHLERPRAGNDSMTRFVIGFLGVTAAPLVLFGLLPHVVTSAIYGREYAPAAPLLFPLASAILFLYVAYIAAQILIAARRPWLIAVFAAAVVIEVALVLLHHDSLQTVATIIVSTRAAAAAVMIGGVVMRRRRT
jgi:O-antigen/teichoic acid export membrane protein